MARPRRFTYEDGEFTFSAKLRAAIRAHPIPAFQIARACKIKSSTFYKFTMGHCPVSKKDPRIAKLAEAVQVPYDECLVEFHLWGQ